MPFQLSTQMYGGGGGEERQRSPFGTLSGLLDMQMRQEALDSQKEQRALINEQRQQAIDKVTRENKENADLDTIYETTQNPTIEQLAKAVGYARAKALYEGTVAAHNVNAKNHVERVASWAGAIAAYPQDKQSQAYDAMMKQLLAEGRIDAEEASVPYSPERLTFYRTRALTPLQQTQEETSRGNLKNTTAAEARLKAEADRKAAGERAKSLAEARAELVQALKVAKSPVLYSALLDRAAAQDPDIVLGIPEVGDFVANRKGTIADLSELGLTPEQSAANADRDAARNQAAQFHRETETRLKTQSGEGLVTNQMRQRALTGRADDQRRLQERVSDAIAAGKPLPQHVIEDEKLRIEQAYSDELRQPPNLRLADARKQVQLDALEAELKRRNTPTKSGDEVVPPRNPMTDEELNRRKLAIQNTYRSWLQMGPEEAAPTAQPTPRAGGGTPLGALVNPTPPVVAPPAAPALSPVVNPVAATAALAQVQQEIDALKRASGARPTPEQTRAYAALRAKKQQLLAQGR